VALSRMVGEGSKWIDVDMCKSADDSGRTDGTRRSKNALDSGSDRDMRAIDNIMSLDGSDIEKEGTAEAVMVEIEVKKRSGEERVQVMFGREMLQEPENEVPFSYLPHLPLDTPIIFHFDLSFSGRN